MGGDAIMVRSVGGECSDRRNGQAGEIDRAKSRPPVLERVPEVGEQLPVHGVHEEQFDKNASGGEGAFVRLTLGDNLTTSLHESVEHDEVGIDDDQIDVVVLTRWAESVKFLGPTPEHCDLEFRLRKRSDRLAEQLDVVRHRTSISRTNAE